MKPIKQKAFTLIEISITLALLSLLLLITTLSYTDFLQTHYQREFKFQLKSLLAFANREAKLGQKLVCVCMSDRINECSSQGGHTMRIVEMTSNSNKVIYQIETQPASAQVIWKGFHYHDKLCMTPRMMNEESNGEFIYRQTPHAKAYAVVLNRLGRVKRDEYSIKKSLSPRLNLKSPDYNSTA